MAYKKASPGALRDWLVDRIQTERHNISVCETAQKVLAQAPDPYAALACRDGIHFLYKDTLLVVMAGEVRWTNEEGTGLCAVNSLPAEVLARLKGKDV